MTNNSWIRDYYVLSTNFDMFVSKFGKSLVLKKLDNLLNDKVADSNPELKAKLIETKKYLEEIIRLEAESYEESSKSMY